MKVVYKELTRESKRMSRGGRGGKNGRKRIDVDAPRELCE